MMTYDEDFDDDDPDFELNDFEWVVSSLAYAYAEGLTIGDIYPTIEMASNGEEFDAGVVAMIRLKEITGGSF